MSKQRDPSVLALVITLPNRRRCTIHSYVESWRTLKALPPDHLVANFFDWPEPAERILREIRIGVHDRINRRDPRFVLRGRKWDQAWQTDCLRTARAVNTPHLVVRQVCLDYYDRLRHRLDA